MYVTHISYKFSIFDIRPYIGLSTIEFLFLAHLLFLNFIVKINPNQSYRFLNKRITYLVIISILSLLLFSTDLSKGLRTILYYLRPIIILYIISKYSYTLGDIESFLKLIKFIVISNIVAAYIQILFFSATVDELSGFMDDAHSFAFLIYMAIIFLTVELFLYKKHKNLFYIIVLLIPALIASADKLTLIMIPLILIIYTIINKINFFKIIKISVITVILSIILLYSFFLLPIDFQIELTGGLFRFRDLLVIKNIPFFLSQIRLIDGYTHIPKFILEYPQILFLGVGPAMYGSAEVLGEFFNVATTRSFGLLSSSSLKNFAFGGNLLFTNYSLFGTYSTSFASSDIIVLILEFGLIFFVIYSKIFLFIIKRLLILTKETNSTIKTCSYFLISYLIFLLFIGLISFQDGIIRSSNVFIYFIFIGIMISLNYDGMKNETKRASLRKKT